MARIKVTGYIDTGDLGEEEIDLDSPTGLSAQGFENIIMDLGLSEPVTVELQK